jgi:hypothetical protein
MKRMNKMTTQLEVIKNNLIPYEEIELLNCRITEIDINYIKNGKCKIIFNFSYNEIENNFDEIMLKKLFNNYVDINIKGIKK